MAMGIVGKADFVRFLEPIKQVEDDRGLLEDERINFDPGRFERFKKLIHNIVWSEKPRLYRFWNEVHRDGELLPSLARLLWYTGSWEDMNRNIFALLAMQHGSRERSANVMMNGGLSVISPAYGDGWERFEKRGRRLFFNADIVKMRGVETVPYELSLKSHLSLSRRTLESVFLGIKPRLWVEGVHQISDLGVSVKYDGMPLKLNGEIDKMPAMGNAGAEFRGKRFCASLSLTPLRSKCLSIAIYNIAKPAYGRAPAVYRGAVHAMFIHPIGVLPKG